MKECIFSLKSQKNPCRMSFKASVCDASFVLVPYVQLKKREKHPERSFAAFNFTATPLHGCFFTFLNCSNCTKSRKASHLLFKLNWMTKFLLGKSRYTHVGAQSVRARSSILVITGFDFCKTARLKKALKAFTIV